MRHVPARFVLLLVLVVAFASSCGDIVHRDTDANDTRCVLDESRIDSCQL